MSSAMERDMFVDTRIRHPLFQGFTDCIIRQGNVVLDLCFLLSKVELHLIVRSRRNVVPRQITDIRKS